MSSVLAENTQEFMNHELRQRIVAAGFVWEQLEASLTAEERSTGNVVVLRMERGPDAGRPLKVVITSQALSPEVTAEDVLFNDVVGNMLRTAVTCLQVSDRLKTLNLK